MICGMETNIHKTHYGKSSHTLTSQLSSVLQEMLFTQYSVSWSRRHLISCVSKQYYQASHLACYVKINEKHLSSFDYLVISIYLNLL